MTVAWGVDVSARPLPSPDALRAHDPPLTFVISYISSPGGLAKDWSRAEIDVYRAAGIDVGIVFEDAERDYLGGFYAGQRKAGVAADRLDALGLRDAAGVVYCAYDAGITDAEQRVVVEFQRGWNSILDVTGRAAYGNNRVMRWLRIERLIDYGWEMQWATPGVWDSRSQLRQHGRATVGGTAVDLDESMAPDWGQWRWGPMSAADAAAGIREVLRLPAGVNLDVIGGQTDNRHALAMLASYGQAEHNSAAAVLAALAGIRQTVGPAAARDAAILAAVAALPTRLDADQVAELAAALHLDADAVAVAVAHRVTVQLVAAAP